MSRVMHLQQQLHDLRKREHLAKQHNRQLMQQFEEAQDTLRKMLDRTAAMKMLREEYEKYFERCSYWDYKLKTQTAQENRNGGCLKACQKKSEEQLSKSNNTQLFEQGLGKMPRKMETYQELAPSLERLPSWQTQAQLQTTLFPNRMSNHPWDISQTSTSTLLSHLLRPQPFPSTLSHQHSSPQQESVSTDYPCPCPNRYLSDHNVLGQLYTNQLFPQPAQEKEAVPKRPQSSKSVTSTESNSNSQELEFKPVRLSSGQAEHRDSSRASSQGSTEKKKWRVKKSVESSASQRDKHSSPESSESRAVTTLNTMATNSESEKSNGRKARSSGLDFQQTNINSEYSSASHNEENETDAEECRSDKMSQSATGQRESRKEIEKEQNFSDQSSLEDEEDDPEKEQTDVEGKETSQDDDDNQHKDIPRYTSTEDPDHEMDESEDQTDLENTEESVLSQGEKGEDKMEGYESKKGLSKNTAHRPEESDSEDCIISPQSRSKVIYVIPEHPTEHEEENSKTPSSDNQGSTGLSDEDDVERLLAPQEQTQKHKEEPKADDKSKACETAARFFVKQDGQTDRHSDSDESDHFYD